MEVKYAALARDRAVDADGDVDMQLASAPTGAPHTPATFQERVGQMRLRSRATGARIASGEFKGGRLGIWRYAPYGTDHEALHKQIFTYLDYQSAARFGCTGSLQFAMRYDLEQPHKLANYTIDARLMYNVAAGGDGRHRQPFLHWAEAHGKGVRSITLYESTDRKSDLYIKDARKSLLIQTFPDVVGTQHFAKLFPFLVELRIDSAMGGARMFGAAAARSLWSRSLRVIEIDGDFNADEQTDPRGEPDTTALLLDNIRNMYTVGTGAAAVDTAAATTPPPLRELHLGGGTQAWPQAVLEAFVADGACVRVMGGLSKLSLTFAFHVSGHEPPILLIQRCRSLTDLELRTPFLSVEHARDLEDEMPMLLRCLAKCAPALRRLSVGISYYLDPEGESVPLGPLVEPLRALRHLEYLDLGFAVRADDLDAYLDFLADHRRTLRDLRMRLYDCSAFLGEAAWDGDAFLRAWGNRSSAVDASGDGTPGMPRFRAWGGFGGIDALRYGDTSTDDLMVVGVREMQHFLATEFASVPSGRDLGTGFLAYFVLRLTCNTGFYTNAERTRITLTDFQEELNALEYILERGGYDRKDTRVGAASAAPVVVVAAGAGAAMPAAEGKEAKTAMPAAEGKEAKATEAKEAQEEGEEEPSIPRRMQRRLEQQLMQLHIRIVGERAAFEDEEKQLADILSKCPQTLVDTHVDDHNDLLSVVFAQSANRNGINVFIGSDVDDGEGEAEGDDAEEDAGPDEDGGGDEDEDMAYDPTAGAHAAH